MQNYDDLIADALKRVKEVMPWDLAAELEVEAGVAPLLLDVREPAEFDALHIPGSINVPRGVLEQACEWDYDETLPLLAAGRSLAIVVVCRSGKRSVLAADAMKKLGFSNVVSLKTGVRGWNDFDQLLVDEDGNTVDGDTAEGMLAPHLRLEQRRPK